ncbi:MAG: 2-C-methyl-D-erythritol 4-phosphate cytidylyltransferase [Nitrospirae bacterium]|nr:2-C-methyl-D-erythritol 4-phosphate cytidylyltransferase [Candidatus Troglogloeales bacterium]MBI3598831.1 2-C-methyl-D-erythritol 4-phosphate cytidylyltransferase [Candidatus Troglogloeales bacterium]
MTHAVIVAAGEGKRAGGAVKKQFAPLAGRPVIIHALTPFFESDVVDQIVCVIAKEDRVALETSMASYPALKIDHVIEGGEARQDSVAAGVFFLEKHYPKDDLVVVHDGVRPFVTATLIQKVIEAVSNSQGAVAAMKVTDSLKEVDADHLVLRSVPREPVWAMQTPQAFPLGVLAEALRKARDCGFVGTDEADIVQQIGYPILCVSGSPDNIKITTASDLSRAEKMLSSSLPFKGSGRVGMV